jgi:hypothetical protein
MSILDKKFDNIISSEDCGLRENKFFLKGVGIILLRYDIS